MLFYATSYLDFAGYLLTAFFLYGGWYLIRMRQPHTLPLFFGLLYWMVLSKIGLHWERWALPMYTCPLLIAAYGMDFAAGKVSQLRGSLKLTIQSTALGIIFLPLLVACLATTARFTLADTRVASYQFTREDGIREQSTLYEGYTPFYPSSLRDGSVRIAFGIHDRHKKIDHIIVSSAVYDRYLGERDRYPLDVEFYARVFELPLVRQFCAKEYFPEGSPFYFNNRFAREIAFLFDYTRNKEQLYTGPTVQIYKYNHPGFLD
jgi:hypothetical protein